mmetsp:Transcript_155889/g.290955  ORF Transcript_155889/g.290955 Transcript_155889/m.290955 type:complete len:162 (+) Transcript_155889:233-718(+)
MLLATMGGLATPVIWGRDTFCMYWPLIMGGGPPGPIEAMGGGAPIAIEPIPGGGIDAYGGGGAPMDIDIVCGGMDPMGGPPIGGIDIDIVCGGIDPMGGAPIGGIEPGGIVAIGDPPNDPGGSVPIGGWKEPGGAVMNEVIVAAERRKTISEGVCWPNKVN